MTSCIEIEEIQFIQGFTSKNNSHQRLGHILSAAYSFSERGVIASSRIYLKSLIVLIRHRETQNWNNCNRRYSMLGIPC